MLVRQQLGLGLPDRCGGTTVSTAAGMARSNGRRRCSSEASLWYWRCFVRLCCHGPAMPKPDSDKAPPMRAASPPVIVVDVKGTIGVGTGHLIEEVLARARSERAGLVVLRLDTPGGLVSATREVIGAILASPVPVVVFVAPTGARAASAGTYIAYAAHVAAMAPGTHLGAATPVQMGAPPGPGPTPQPRRDGEKPESDRVRRDGTESVERCRRLPAQPRAASGPQRRMGREGGARRRDADGRRGGAREGRRSARRQSSAICSIAWTAARCALPMASTCSPRAMRGCSRWSPAGRAACSPSSPIPTSPSSC